MVVGRGREDRQTCVSGQIGSMHSGPDENDQLFYGDMATGDEQMAVISNGMQLF